MTARYLDPTNDVAFKKLFNNKEGFSCIFGPNWQWPQN